MFIKQAKVGHSKYVTLTSFFLYLSLFLSLYLSIFLWLFGITNRACLQHLFEQLSSVCLALHTLLSNFLAHISQPPAACSSQLVLLSHMHGQRFSTHYKIAVVSVMRMPDQSQDYNECAHFIRMMGGGMRGFQAF